jgi:hypothetical protein
VTAYFFAGALAGSAAFAGAAGAISGAFASSVDAQKFSNIAKLIIANTLVIFFIDSPIFMSFIALLWT